VELGRRLLTPDPNDAQFPLLARGATTGGGAGGGGAVAATFSALRDTVLVPQCANCHSASLPPAITYEGLVGRASVQGPGGMSYVEPGNPGASWALVRMRALHGTGPMPIAGPLPAAQLDAFEAWIANGALND
jgi:hypothetical protein